MKHLYDTYGDKGFTVLAFPCNQFGAQEPGTAAQIKDFVRNRYGGNYPVFDKVCSQVLRGVGLMGMPCTQCTHCAKFWIQAPFGYQPSPKRSDTRG